MCASDAATHNTRPNLKQLLKLEVAAAPQCELSDVVTRHAAAALRRPVHTVDSTPRAILARMHKLVGDARDRMIRVRLRRQHLQHQHQQHHWHRRRQGLQQGCGDANGWCC